MQKSQLTQLFVAMEGVEIHLMLQKFPSRKALGSKSSSKCQGYIANE